MVNILRIICGLIVGTTLTVAAVAKLANFKWFVSIVAGYKLLVPSLNLPIAAGIVGLELVVGPLLLFGNPNAAWIAVMMFLLFGVITARNIFKKRFDSKCGCFGPNGGMISWRLLARNVGCAGLAWLVTMPVSSKLMLLSWILFVGLLCVTLTQASRKRNEIVEA